MEEYRIVILENIPSILTNTSISHLFTIGYQSPREKSGQDEFIFEPNNACTQNSTKKWKILGQ